MSTTSSAFASNPSVTLGKPNSDLTLRIFYGNGKTKEVRVASSKCSIGSSTGCTIELNESGIQPVHCIVLRGTDKTVVRRWAPNAWLNGEHFVDAILNSGDELRLANVTIKVFFEAERASTTIPTSGVRRWTSPSPHTIDARQDNEPLTQLVQRLHAAETRVDQLQSEVNLNQHSAATIGEQIKRIERLVRSDSAKRYQGVLAQLHREKNELERQSKALELRHKEERAFWLLEHDRVAAELVRQSEQNRLEQRKTAAQAQRIADLEASSGTAQTVAQNHKLARAEKQLSDHVAALETVREQLNVEQTRHEAELKSLREALQRGQNDLAEAQQQLQTKQNEISTQQLSQQQRESEHTGHIVQLESAVQQNRDECDRLTAQLQTQRIAQEQALETRDAQINQLENELKQHESTCNELREQLETARRAESSQDQLADELCQVQAELRLTQQHRETLTAELDQIQSNELTQLNEERAHLQSALAASQAACQQLESELATATEMAVNAANQEARDVRVDELNEQVSKLTDELLQSETARDGLQAELAKNREQQAELTQRISDLEDSLAERTEAINELQATLAQADEASAQNEAQLAARIASLQAELQQNAKQQDALRDQIQSLQSEEQNNADRRVEELQTALDESQQLRDTLQQELEAYQASADSESEALQQQQSDLLEQHNRLVERCEELDQECAQLHDQLNATQLATEGREQENQLTQQELDQRIGQLQQELEDRQSNWESREASLNQTIEDLQRQLEEVQTSAQQGDHSAATPHAMHEVETQPAEEDGSGEEDADINAVDHNESLTDPIVETTIESALESTDSIEIEDEWSSDQDASAVVDSEIAESTAPRFCDAADSLGSSEPESDSENWNDDSPLSDDNDDPFASALNLIESSTPPLPTHHPEQNQPTNGSDVSDLGDEPADPFASINIAGDQFDVSESDVEEDSSESNSDMKDSFDDEFETADNSGPQAFQPSGDAEAELLARIRAMTGQDASSSSNDDDIVQDDNRDGDSTNDDQIDASLDEEVVEDNEEDAMISATHGKTDDLSIEDYMQRLLNRVSIDQPSEKVQTVVMDDDQLSSPQRIETKKIHSLSSSTNRERPVRKLTTEELGAMRELANASSRSALSHHARRSTEKAAISTLATAIICFLTAGILLYPTRGEFSALFVCGALVAIIAVYFGYKAFRAGAVALVMTAIENRSKKTATTAKTKSDRLAATATAKNGLAAESTPAAAEAKNDLAALIASTETTNN